LVDKIRVVLHGAHHCTESSIAQSPPLHRALHCTEPSIARNPPLHEALHCTEPSIARSPPLNGALHCAEPSIERSPPLRGALPKTNFKIFAKTRLSLLDQDFFLKLTSKNRTQAKCSASSLRCILPAVSFPSSYLIHSPRFYFIPAYPPQKDERALPEVFPEHQTFLLPQ
jgi:hypothetical protein